MRCAGSRGRVCTPSNERQTTESWSNRPVRLPRAARTPAWRTAGRGEWGRDRLAGVAAPMGGVRVSGAGAASRFRGRELAATFWPDVLDQSARASLRSALWVLRRRLGDALAVDGERVGLRDEPGLWVDVREFERLAAGDPAAALELCRGDLLEGLEDDWAVSARDRHRERVIELLEELANAAEERGEARDAIELTRRQVECDRFDEDAHRRLIARLDARRRSRRRDAHLPRAGRAPAARARGGASRRRRASWSSGCAGRRRPTRSPALLRRCPVLGRRWCGRASRESSPSSSRRGRRSAPARAPPP